MAIQPVQLAYGSPTGIWLADISTGQTSGRTTALTGCPLLGIACSGITSMHKTYKNLQNCNKNSQKYHTETQTLCSKMIQTFPVPSLNFHPGQTRHLLYLCHVMLAVAVHTQVAYRIFISVLTAIQHKTCRQQDLPLTSFQATSA